MLSSFPSLTLLQTALELSNTGTATALMALEKQQQLKQIRELLAEYQLPICHDCCPVEMLPLQVRYCFVRAILLAKMYPQLGSAKAKGSIKSSTLPHFCPDLFPVAIADLTVDQLCSLYQLPTKMAIELAGEVASIAVKIEQRTRLIEAAIANSNSTLSLFQHLFGNLSLPAAALTYLATDTQLFFAIAYQGKQLCDRSLWQGLSSAERAQLQVFFSRLNSFELEQSRNFPILVNCDFSSIDIEWCKSVAKSAQITTEQVVRYLPQCIGIIPAPEIEKYLIHDIWGHNWQSAIPKFVSDHNYLASCAQPLQAEMTVDTTAGRLSYREVFELKNSRVELNESGARQFFQAEAARRLRAVQTHIIAELTADIAEYKLIQDNPTLTSNLIK